MMDYEFIFNKFAIIMATLHGWVGGLGKGLCCMIAWKHIVIKTTGKDNIINL